MLIRLYKVVQKNGYIHHIGENEFSEISVDGLKRFCAKVKWNFDDLDINSFERTNLVYESETKIVYYKSLETEKSGGYMCPYIYKNGSHCFYDDRVDYYRIQSLSYLRI